MVQFLAFSLQDQVEKYGAYVGIAAFFGLAVLTILYFSQARELRRLRDWAGRAPERAQEIEARVVANADAARRVQGEPIASTAPSAAAVAAATAAGSRAGGGAPAGGGEQATQVVEPVEDAAAAQAGNGTAAAAESAEGGAPPSDEAAAEAPEASDQQAEEAPEGTADGDREQEEQAEEAPDAGAAAEGDESEAPAEAPAAAAAPSDDGDEDEKPPADRAPEPARPGEIPAAPVPRATPLPRRTPAPAAPLRQPNRSSTLPPRRPAPAAPRGRRPATSDTGRRTSRGALIGLGAGAVVVLAAVALFATGVIGGSDDENPPVPNTTTEPTAQSSPEAAALTPAETKVAVLNGTTTIGLASGAADEIRAAGYSGEVTTGNNTDQQRAESEVLYGGRSGARRQASSIARRLQIDTIGRLDADTRSLSENADVVVILGQDKAP